MTALSRKKNIKSRFAAISAKFDPRFNSGKKFKDPHELQGRASNISFESSAALLEKD